MIQARHRQVFYSESNKRWQLFLSALRIIAVIICFTVTVVVISIEHSSTRKMPKLDAFNQLHNSILSPERAGIFQTQAIKDYNKLRTQLSETTPKAVAPYFSDSAEAIKTTRSNIRGVFFFNGEPDALLSLKQNITHINCIIPECFEVNDSGCALTCNIDTAVLAIAQRRAILNLPLLVIEANNKSGVSSVVGMLSTQRSRLDFIRNIVRAVAGMRANGITVDFEDIPNRMTTNYVSFIGELYRALHAEGLLLCNEIPVDFETDAIVKTISFTDLFVLMAYDMHARESGPGPVADYRWVERALKTCETLIPIKKVILGIPAYGYNWKDRGACQEVKYEEAVSIANAVPVKVQFDSTYNCHFQYPDESNAAHAVWFSDAITCYDMMRCASAFKCAGVVLNGLGGEDQRIWTFFHRDIPCDSSRFDTSIVKALEKIPNSQQVDFQGEGEVLDPVSEPDSGRASMTVDPNSCLIVNEHYDKLPSVFLINRIGKTPLKKVLTFDDGPSKEFTPKILDILKEKKVPAVFFIVGVNGENNFPLLRRIYREGHELGNHSFTHPNLAEESLEKVRLELNATRRIIECVTGHSTILFRPPYNADYEPRTREELVPVLDARKESYYTISNLIDPHDWEPGVTADSIVARVKRQNKDGNIILLHDAGGDRNATIQALPAIIDYFRSQGNTFISVADLMGKPRSEIMPPISDIRDRLMADINWTSAAVVYLIERSVLALFFISIFLTIGRTVLIASLAAIQKRKSERHPVQPLSEFPLVSVIVPAHNEEVTAVGSVKRLLKSDYPGFEIVFVDDGSTDSTYAKVRGAFAENPKVRVFTKENGGKATALNYGINQAQGRFLVCIDADTHLKSDAISRLMEYFTDETVAAVAGNVKVGNERNLLTRWQSIEYITSQNFDRRAFDLVNAITVVPGAIGAFRKSAVVQIGMLKNDTLAEDCDLTVRLLRAGYRVRHCSAAIAMTEVPESLKMFLKQRFRWSFGILQSMWKHRDTMLIRGHKNLGLIALPNALFFQFIMPLLAPLADIYMIFSIVVGNWRLVIGYYIMFTIVDIAAAMVAFSFEKEDMRRLWLLIPHRISYRILMYYVLIKSILAAIKGRLVGWGILKRMGTVNATT